MTDVAAIPVLDLTTVSSGMLLRRRIMAHRGLLIGTGLLAFIVLAALFAPLIAPHDPYAQDLSRRMIPPIWYEKGNWAHLLGTDNLGRDYLSRVLYGAQISLLIGAAVMVISVSGDTRRPCSSITWCAIASRNAGSPGMGAY